MSDHHKVVRWFGRAIELDAEYLVYFADEKRELSSKQLAEYRYIRHNLPQRAKWMELAALDPRNNPNVTPMQGRDLIALSEQGYVPIFDRFFDDDDLRRELSGESVAVANRRKVPGVNRLEVKNPNRTRRVTMIPPDGVRFFTENQMDRMNR